MHQNCELMFRKFARNYIADDTSSVLEIGPDDFPSTFQTICGRVGKQWDTIDLAPYKKLTYRGTDPYHYPIASETYDIVLAANVLEHVPKIWTWVREVARIIRPGGIAIVIAPCSWPYHAVPQDCWRVYPDGMRALMEEGGLSVEIAEWGTLEFPEISCALPGRSFEHQPESYREQAMPLVEQGAFPMEKSFDTICVARKF